MSVSKSTDFQRLTHPSPSRPVVNLNLFRPFFSKHVTTQLPFNEKSSATKGFFYKDPTILKINLHRVYADGHSPPQRASIKNEPMQLKGFVELGGDVRQPLDAKGSDWQDYDLAIPNILSNSRTPNSVRVGRPSAAQ